MARSLDSATLEAAARYYAAEFLRPDAVDAAGVPSGGPAFVMGQFYNFTFKDEFETLLAEIREHLGRKALAEFDRLAGNTFKPHSEQLFHDLLAKKLAIDPDGGHLEGRIGTTKIGARFVALHDVEVETPASIKFRQWAKEQGRDPGPRQTMRKTVPLYWPVYAGELEERATGRGAADELPPGADPFPLDVLAALNTRISNEAALGACDYVVDRLDEGAGAAIVQGRSGTQPADPDTTVTGTLLFTLVCSDPAFGAAADAAPGGRATASAVTSDSSADATGTLGYCRASSSNDGATALDDHIDGEAGTSGADFNFNTLAIVSGSTVSLTSWTVTMPES